LRGFLAEFPQSVYTPFARFALAQGYLRRKQYSEAASLFHELAERHPHAPVAEDALFLLGECCRLSGQAAKAAWAYREVVRRYPETPAATDALETLTDVRGYPEMLFAEDRRLDTEISFPPNEIVAFETAVATASRLTGLVLEVRPEDRRPWICRDAQKRPLRSFMADWASRENGIWTPTATGGYRLGPDPYNKAASKCSDQ
jgi:tetratricopeptide (TPR) repeat protein